MGGGECYRFINDVDSLAVISRVDIFSAFSTNGVSDLLVPMDNKKSVIIVGCWGHGNPIEGLADSAVPETALFSAGALREKEKGNSFIYHPQYKANIMQYPLSWNLVIFGFGFPLLILQAFPCLLHGLLLLGRPSRPISLMNRQSSQGVKQPMGWDGVTFHSTIKSSIKSFDATAGKAAISGFYNQPYISQWIHFNQIVIIPKKRSHLQLFHPQTLSLRTSIKSRVKRGVWRKIPFVTGPWKLMWQCTFELILND